MKCPSCGQDMEPGYIYVRGIGGSLFWSKSKNTRFFSRKGLEQIDLSKVSVTGIGAQAVLNASRCEPCSTVTFKSK